MIALSRKTPFRRWNATPSEEFPRLFIRFFRFRSDAATSNERCPRSMRTNCGRERVRERACMERVYRGGWEGRGG